MSVVVSYVSNTIPNNDLSVIIADTRISYGKSMDSIEYYTDDNQKLFSVKDMGWFSGVGLESFLDDIKNKLNSTNIKTVDDIVDIYKSCLNKMGLPAQQRNEMYISGIVLSWFGQDEKKIAKFLLGVLNSNSIKHLQHLQEDNIFIYFPTDYKNDPEDNIYFKYKYDGNLNKLLYNLVKNFKTISEKSKYVSDICDIGIHGNINNKLIKVRIRENADTLLNDLKSGTINHKFKSYL